MSSVLIICYFLVLMLTFFVSTKTIQGPWFFLLRAFFPNWKFYHSLGWQPQLHIKARLAEPVRSNPAQSPEWTLTRWVYPRAKRGMIKLFYNPHVNMALAHQNMVEHLASDLQQLPEDHNAADLVSYKLIRRFVEHCVVAEFAKDIENAPHSGGRLSQGYEYSFEIHLRLNDPNRGAESHTLMISPIYALDDQVPLSPLLLDVA
jgi:hypothetical protein